MEVWRQCAHWLVAARVLPAGHRASSPTGQVWDLAQALRDGVLLCHLLNALLPNAVPPRDICPRPQMSQFLCLRNIRTFLTACADKFGLPKHRLFGAFDLFDVQDFGKVIDTLSTLSWTPIAQSKGFTPFPTEECDGDDEIYSGLSDLIDDTVEDDDELYDCVEAEGDDGDDIYEDLMRVEVPPSARVEVDRRHCCLQELRQTEEKYTETLESICTVGDLGLSSGTDIRMKLQECSQRANNGRFSLRDLLMVPMQRVLKYHLLLQELVKLTPDPSERERLRAALDAMRVGGRGGGPGQRQRRGPQSLAQFGRPKIDGELKVCSSERRSKADRYGFLLDKALIICKRRGDAYEAKDVVDLQSHQLRDSGLGPRDGKKPPQPQSLAQFGRPKIDGELKVCSSERRSKADRYGFLLDKALIICKRRGDAYEAKDVVDLQSHQLRDSGLGPRDGKKWSHTFLLINTAGLQGYELFFKTRELKKKWLEQFEMALSNIFPEHALADGHDFQMFSFEDTTSCRACQMLLRGTFYQGYRCNRCRAPAHKECLGRMGTCGADPSSGNRKMKSQRPGHENKTADLGLPKMEASQHYSGVPPPPGNVGPALRLSPGDVVEAMVAEVEQLWWQGRNVVNGETGWFPCAAVRPFICAPLPDLSVYLWYAGPMERGEAEQILTPRSDGTFLVRQRVKDTGEFAISINPTPNPTGAVRSFGSAKARYDFCARDRTELTLREGDIIRVLSKKGHPGWWKGEIYGRVGWFPANYVEEDYSEYC
ncbi:proto-oncogene vav-like [Phasianus colchicus]|uniref:proto-oncogene vav-like n=1 Tax=Phasianus colchicus TaxID=9054 RepID=UPI00129DB715|nr:proto-oncogene vav-like [Phasianus colchicus]